MDMIKLNQLCDINIGKTPSRGEPTYWGRGEKWIAISDLKSKYIHQTKEAITQRAIDDCNMRLIPKNTVIMSFKLTIGKTAITGEDIYSNEAIANFPIKDTTKLIPEYLYYALLTLNFMGTTDRAVMGATLNKAKLNEILIPVADIDTQQKIVTILDKSQSLIDKRKEQIEACDELVKSLFYEMFGDPITNANNLPTKPLGEICNMKAGKGIKAKDIYQVCEEQMYPCYGGNGLRGYAESYTHEGAIPLIGRQGALCGNVKYATGKFYATEHAVVTQPISPMNTMWLYIMLMEMNLNRLATGAAQPGLNVSTLVPLEVIVPDLILQNKFAAQVEKIEQQKQLLEQSLTELENNFNSLMQRAFKGELF